MYLWFISLVGFLAVTKFTGCLSDSPGSTLHCYFFLPNQQEIFPVNAVFNNYFNSTDYFIKVDCLLIQQNHSLKLFLTDFVNNIMIYQQNYFALVIQQKTSGCPQPLSFTRPLT